MDGPVTFESPEEIRRSIVREVQRGRFLHRSGLARWLSWGGARLRKLANSAEIYARDERYAEIKTTGSDSDYGYEGDREDTDGWLAYWWQVEHAPDQKASRSSFLLYERQLDLARALLRERGDIRTFVNFGVCYAHIDNILAREFPEVRFLGVDRAAFVKVLNEHCFPAVPNLEFVAADIRDVLTEAAFEGPAVLFHSRIMTLLPTSAVSDLYARAAEAGVAAVLGFEPIGVCRETGRDYVFDQAKEQPTWHYRAFMYVHNYPQILAASGFDTSVFEALDVEHPKRPDFRMLTYRADKLQPASLLAEV